MGLDIYLYRYIEDAQVMAKAEQEYKRRSDAAWKEITGDKKYEELTDLEKKKAREATKAIQVELELGEYGEHPGKEKIELDSVYHPKHMFKIGYFRSSYNDSGINSVLGRAGIPDLYHIFDQQGEDDFQPDWKQSLIRANDVRDRWSKHCKSDSGQYDVLEVRVDKLDVTSKKDALKSFMAELTSHKDGIFRSYSSGRGDFWLDGQEVVGIIPGRAMFPMFGEHCVYVIYKKPINSEGDYYAQALSITVEMIEWVLAQEKIEQYWLHWSG